MTRLRMNLFVCCPAFQAVCDLPHAKAWTTYRPGLKVRVQVRPE